MKMNRLILIVAACLIALSVALAFLAETQKRSGRSVPPAKITDPGTTAEQYEESKSKRQPLKEESPDQLDINAEVIGDELRVVIVSNLPSDYEVETWIYAYRTHEMIEDGEIARGHDGKPLLYGGVYFDKEGPLSDWRANPPTFSIADKVWHDYVNSEQDRTAGFGWYWEVGGISDHIDILVSHHVGGSYVKKEIQVQRPLGGSVRGTSNIVLGNDLKVGEVYTYSGEITVVTGTPQNPDPGLTGILHSDGEGEWVFAVVKRSTTCRLCSESTPWYYILLTTSDERDLVWINSAQWWATRMTRLGEIPEIMDANTHLEELELYGVIPDLNAFLR